MKRSTFLKISALATLAVAATGCSPHSNWGDGTAYTANERGKLISHAWNTDGRQMIDDIDSVLMLRPSSSLSGWNVP